MSIVCDLASYRWDSSEYSGDLLARVFAGVVISEMLLKLMKITTVYLTGDLTDLDEERMSNCRLIFGIFKFDWLRLFALHRWWFLGVGRGIFSWRRTTQNGVWVVSALGQIQTSLQIGISQQWRVIWIKVLNSRLLEELQKWSLCLMLKIIDFGWLFES